MSKFHIPTSVSLCPSTALDHPGSRSHSRVFQTEEIHSVSGSCFAADSTAWELPRILKSLQNLWIEAQVSVAFKALQVIPRCSTELMG